MNKANLVELLAVDVVLDYSIYPRQAINDWHLGDITEAIRAEKNLPPIIVERGTNRCVDGFHRVTAVLRVHGTAARIWADPREYPNDAALLEEAVILNAGHGRSLTTVDRARCILLLRKMGLPDARIAGALAITPRKFDEILALRTAIGPDDQPVPIKRNVALALHSHVQQPKLSDAQARGNDAMGSNSVRFYAFQIVNALDNELFDWDDEKAVAALRELYHTLFDQLKRHKQTAAAA